MRKFALLLLLLPTFIMVVSGAANAQRKNSTSHEVKKIEDNINDHKENIENNKKNMKKDCNCDCEHHKKHKKKHHKKHREE